MIPIQKATEPPLLARFRAIPGAEYDGGATEDGLTFTQVKEEIRKYLVREQCYLCAYCMSRIRPTEVDMKVEHWASREEHSDLQLRYSNLLGCCCGISQKNGETEKHCDTSRSVRNESLAFNPSEPTHHARLQIRYTPNGEIGSADPAFDHQIKTALNLNATRLVENRKETWSRVTEMLNTIRGPAPRATIQSIRTKWKSINGRGELQPYCGVAVQYLDKRLARP